MSPEESNRSALTPFVTRRVDEFTYATSPNHPRYRVITRYFYEQHLRLRDWLAPREVFAHVQRILEPEYTENACEHDLQSLRAWGNLIAEQDHSKARTLAEFYRPRLVYHISQFSVDLEALLLKHEGRTGTSGSLNASLLDRMWLGLEYLQAILAEPCPDPLTGDFLARQIQQPWGDVIGAFTELRESATAYHHTLSAMRPSDLAQTEAFLIYKDTLLEHLRGFITQLQRYSPKIRNLLARWQSGATAGRLVDLLTEHDRVQKVSRLGLVGAPLTLEQVRTQVHAPQFASLAEWFHLDGGCEFLYQATAHAILAIARQNERIATQHTVGMSRRRDLERLARAFAALEGRSEDAHRLAARAFGVAQPRHMRGATQAEYLMTDRESIWRQSPQPQPLRKIRRGRQSTASVAPVRANKEKLDEMRRREEAELAHERALWNQLFSSPTVSFNRLDIIDPVLRTRLLDVIGRCLVDPDQVSLASDGRRVQLTLPPGGTPHGELVGPDGTLYMPRFRLRLLPDTDDGAAPPSDAPKASDEAMTDSADSGATEPPASAARVEHHTVEMTR